MECRRCAGKGRRSDETDDCFICLGKGNLTLTEKELEDYFQNYVPSRE